MINKTIIQNLSVFANNNLFIKREDLIPFSFGGNKARKAQLFFDEIDNEGYDAVVTYGSSSSNHCRIIANMAASKGIECTIISPEESSEKTFNLSLMDLFGAKIKTVPVSKVSKEIEATLEELARRNKKAYFIPGGGHGNLGTQAYVECYNEILQYERENNIHFDYIFHASGTGTTQAGLICGKLIQNDDEQKIIGISIARQNPRGRDVVLNSIHDFLNSLNYPIDDKKIEDSTIFIDNYISGGYGCGSKEITETISHVMTNLGIPLDPTYTGKAFYGMLSYLKLNAINNKNILFIHTGGTPLFFDELKNTRK